MPSGEDNGSRPRDTAERSLICFPFGPFQQPCEVLRVEYIRKLRQALSKFREEGGKGLCRRVCLDNPIFPEGCVLTPARPPCLLKALQTHPNFLSYTYGVLNKCATINTSDRVLTPQPAPWCFSTHRLRGQRLGFVAEKPGRD